MVPENRIEKVAPMNCEMLHYLFTTEFIVCHIDGSKCQFSIQYLHELYVCMLPYTNILLLKLLSQIKLADTCWPFYCIRWKCKYSTYRLITFVFFICLHRFSMQYCIYYIHLRIQISCVFNSTHRNIYMPAQSLKYR